MPQTFDISDSQPQLPEKPRTKNSGGTGTPIDDVARTIFYLSLIATVVLLIYILYGIFGGAWSNPTFQSLDKATQQRHLDNIQMLIQIIGISSFVSVLCILICSFRDEGIGYALGGVALVLYVGLPSVTPTILGWQNTTQSHATDAAIQGLQSLWWIFGIPGAIWTVVDIVRRFQGMSEKAAIQRANLKYGSSIDKQKSTQQKLRFLGRCWELPYCRDHVRVKCPIYIKRRGPCWWHKEGCMCEERIVLQAVISTDWKDQAAAASQKLSLSSAAPKPNLSQADKRERCRRCIIYNEHQRQKYQLYVTIALIVVPALMIMNVTLLQTLMGHLLSGVEAATARFQLTQSSGDTNSLMHGDNATILQNVLLGCLGLVLISQILKLIEYCCFKIKV